MPALEKSGVSLEVLEPIFADVPPILSDIYLIRAVVWATEAIRAAGITRTTSPEFSLAGGKVVNATEIPDPINYSASLAVPHSKEGLSVFSANWAAGPGQSEAFLLDRGSNYQYFSAAEAETLVSPEDILEAYNERIRHIVMANVAHMAKVVKLKPNIFTAEGFEDLALSAPKE